MKKTFLILTVLFLYIQNEVVEKCCRWEILMGNNKGNTILLEAWITLNKH